LSRIDPILERLMKLFTLNPEVTIGSILTTVSILITIISLLFAWHKDRQLKRKEYADRIRRAAGTVTAKLERWRELSLRFFDDIQALITDADIKITKEQDAIATRDFLWRGLVIEQAKSSQRILDEMIEIAYIDLYGYDPDIQALFVGAVQRFKAIDRNIHNCVLELTQQDVLELSKTRQPIRSAQLGNALRRTCGKMAVNYDAQIEKINRSFRLEMMKLIEASDIKIVNKQVKISSADDVLPQPSAIHFLIKEDAYNQACKLALSGEQEDALNALKQALKISPALRDLAWLDPDFDILRYDPRFEEMCKPYI
jgi:hypothetical protein